MHSRPALGRGAGGGGGGGWGGARGQGRHQGKAGRNIFFSSSSVGCPEIICSTFVTIPKAPVTKCLGAGLSKGEASLKIRGCPHERGELTKAVMNSSKRAEQPLRESAVVKGLPPKL